MEKKNIIQFDTKVNYIRNVITIMQTELGFYGYYTTITPDGKEYVETCGSEEEYLFTTYHHALDFIMASCRRNHAIYYYGQKAVILHNGVRYDCK
jgi:hypothetical protein